MQGLKKENDNSVYINLTSVFFIICTFCGMAVLIMIMELDFYNKIKVKVDNTFNAGIVVSYLTNKIRNYEGDSITILEDDKYKTSDILLLENKEENLRTYIYSKDGYIYEDIEDNGTEKLPIYSLSQSSHKAYPV